MTSAAILVRPRLRLVAVAAIVAMLLACVAAAGARPVAAAEPTNLRDELTDTVGALTAAEETDVRGTLADLLAETGVQLWVWYLDTTGDRSASDFANSTFEESSMGGTDMLVTIALDDGAYGFAVADAFPLTNAEIERLLSDDLEPGLRDEDYAGAITQLASGLGVALRGSPPPVTPAPTGAPTAPPVDGEDGGGGGGLGTIIMVLLIVGIVAVIGWFLFVRRRHGAALGLPGGSEVGAPGDPYARLDDKELNAEANRLLLETDDDVRDSEQELGFAEAQFGEELAAPFREAIAAAKEDLAAAFHQRQQLDDATPEDRPTKRRMLGEIIARCTAAQKRLDEQADRFEELRAFEKEAPTVLAGLPAAADALEARLPGASTTMAHLEEYADASWEAIAANLDEARTRIAAARAAVTEGQAAQQAGDSPRVAAAARVGQDALAQGGAFLDGIERLAKELDDARDRVSAEIADAEADLARARGAATAPGADPGWPARIAEVESLLAEARRDIGHPKPDVAAAYTKARRANETVDQVLAGIRTAAEQRAALAARLDTSIRGAQATLTRASDYVTTHRGGVRSEARTRLAEAERHLDRAVALGSTDPAAGIREAEQASRLANEALASAQRDYGGWDDPFRGGRGGSGGGGGDVAAAIIGGIIGGMLSGGGGGGFPTGGSGNRGGGGWSSGWGGGRRAGGGSIGGSGGGSRSGGVRSGGGRW